MCLQYSILATGASASPAYEHLAEAFYGRARHYIQANEMQSDDAHVSLAHVQAWILIAHFEAQHLWFSRASMSIARAVRLAQILGLHRLDGKNNAGLTLPPAMDLMEEEERRKTFWTMFCTDRITSSTGGWPTMMDARTIQTHLPASTDTSPYGMSGPSVNLKQALKQDMWGLSSGACRVVAVHLFNECFNFTRDTESDEDANVWEQLMQLENSLSKALETLPLHLRCPKNIGNVDAVFINLQLHTALICIYRAAMTRSPPDITTLPYIQTRVFPSALHIVTIVALVADINTAFRNPLISFAAYIAASFFMEHFLSTGNPESEEKLAAVMDVMVDVGKKNPFTASLAVRLAQESKTSGVDLGALEKVETLLSTLSMNAPLPAQDDKKNGVVILCPAATTSGDCPL
ncbi:hypothetical protein N3K66_009058 [Trichothecium roseum]|uniref:Uncharacterized protein n=1 Tax=Trichothecium roseum TaxID=47278 RepID=A0ACC0UPX5_9HYPO|nr:hypothetical protein N3K66_009058 [Trichothecium roseum]